MLHKMANTTSHKKQQSRYSYGYHHQRNKQQQEDRLKKSKAVATLLDVVLAKSPNVNAIDDDGNTPLILAIQQNNHGIAKKLLKQPTKFAEGRKGYRHDEETLERHRYIW